LGGLARAGGSVLADRLLGLAAGLGISAATLALRPDALPGLPLDRLSWRGAGAGLIGAALAVALGLGLARRGRLGRKLDQATADFRRLLRSPARCAAAVALAVVAQGLVILVWLVLGRAAALPVPLATLAVAVPLVSLGATLPITLGGLGVREAVWLALLDGAGGDGGRVVAVSLLYFACTVAVGLLGGVAFTRRGAALPDRRLTPG
ncbi:MAG TPA: lysylphosphatidylglycerol synthase domain-containing protein, partial [Gemmatimonadales bacterium]|nr:lysylphosphatidylglycerol synthase domain-containing protein [Gemmatimonadales bacterium]